MTDAIQQVTLEDLCGDCGVKPGVQHAAGCDVARCTKCGNQFISHNDGGRPTVWRGEFPGVHECRGMSLFDHAGEPDLNRLASMAAIGLLQWNSGSEQWEPKQWVDADSGSWSIVSPV